MKTRLSNHILTSLISAAGLVTACAVLAVVIVFASTHPEPQNNTSPIRNPLHGAQDGVSSLFRADQSTDEYFAANHFPTLIGAKGDGVANDTKYLKESLRHAGEEGGTVYLPQGIYRITEPITIPTGVTLRGDFSAPSSKVSDGGKTILLVADNEATRNSPLITIKNNGALVGVTVYYEKQTPENIISYPATVYCEESAQIRKIALLNPYQGICITGTGDVNLCTAWISPLDYGILVTSQKNAVTVENCNISPTYWLNYAPTVFSDGATYSTLTEYLHKNMHGIILEQVTDVTLNRIFAEDGAVGLLFNVPKDQDSILLVKETSLASIVRPLELQSLPKAGVLFADSSFRPENDSGADTVRIAAGADAPVIFSNCTFSGLPKRVIKAENNAFISFYHCNFGTWWDVCFDMTADTFVSISPTFKTQNEKALLGRDAFGLLYNAPSLQESSQLLFSIPADQAVQTKSEAVTALKETVKTGTNAPILNALNYGISSEADDNSPAMELLLKEAEKQKAVIFFPEGDYLFQSVLHIPASVRIIGAGNEGSYSTVLRFALKEKTDSSLVELGADASVENLCIRQNFLRADWEKTYAVFSFHSNVRIRNVSIFAPRGIWLAGAENPSIEHVTLSVTQIGLYLQDVKKSHLMDLTVTDTSGSYGAVGLRLQNAEGILSEYRASRLACAVDLTENSTLNATLITLRACSLGVRGNHKGNALITATGFSETGDGGSTVFLQCGADMTGTVTVQGALGAGPSPLGTLVSAASGTAEIRAMIITAPFTTSIVSDGSAVVNAYGCIWDITPTYHATATGGTVTFAANLLRSEQTFEGTEGKYVLSSVGEESGKVDDKINIMQHVYVEVETEIAPDNGATEN